MQDMGRAFLTVVSSFGFLAVNVLILWAVLALNRRSEARSGETTDRQPMITGAQSLPVFEVLGWEFEYARVTASEAMQDRHTMVNFYLLVTGVLVSGVAAVLSRETDLPTETGTVLLWLLCGIGWLYFLKIIRLRQAWHDSAQAMNRIKDFYVQHAAEFDADVLRGAFRWKTETLPPADRAWTVFFYSALLIAFLDSAAYVAGGTLLILGAARPLFWITLGLLSAFGLAFFAFHTWLYFEFLKPKPASPVA